MILRNLGLRHGRRALAAAAAAPATSTCLRTFSSSATRPRAAPTTFAEPTLQGQQPQPTPPAAATAPSAEEDPITANYMEWRGQKKATGTVGARVQRRYHPDALLLDPPRDVTLEMLMAAQTHMGHKTTQWNPENQRYITGVREGIHIIGLETTAEYLRRAARVVEEVAFAGGLILFAGTRRGHMPIVARAAELAGGCHLFQPWTPGAITNRDVILADSTLSIVDGQDRVLDGFEEHLRDRRPVKPDLVVCLNPIENATMLHECALEMVPTIGIIDTDADPTSVTYQIPANDDSLRSVTVIAGMLGRAGERGQQRRKEAAEKGQITWQTPSEVVRFMQTQARIRYTSLTEQEAKAIARGTVEEKPAQREDFLTDEELMREMTDGPIVTKVG